MIKDVKDELLMTFHLPLYQPINLSTPRQKRLPFHTPVFFWKTIVTIEATPQTLAVMLKFVFVIVFFFVDLYVFLSSQVFVTPLLFALKALIVRTQGPNKRKTISPIELSRTIVDTQPIG